MPFPFTERADVASPCFCVGPQRGEPVCPCAMRTVQIINGRYVKPAVDLGPAPTEKSSALDNMARRLSLPFKAHVSNGVTPPKNCSFTYAKESTDER